METKHDQSPAPQAQNGKNLSAPDSQETRAQDEALEDHPNARYCLNCGDEVDYWWGGLHEQDCLEKATTPTGVASIPDVDLLKVAVTCARSRRHNKGVKHPRWIAVKDLFQLGSGYAMDLCRRFGLDPDEEVSR